MKEPISLQLEELEERIAPSVTGTGGYDGQPGNQSNAPHNPSGSANPEGSATQKAPSTIDQAPMKGIAR
jgi:hypothetical protein